MRQYLVNYLRFAGLSLVVLALALVWRAAPAAYALGPPEGRQGEPPRSGKISEATADSTQNERLALLEAEVARLDADLTHLRGALALMGPLPDHADLDLPVDTRPVGEIAAAEPPAKPDPLASIRKSDLYAPPPNLAGARSLFYEAELGAYQSRAAAEANWAKIARTAKAAQLTPHYASAGGDTRLTAGPLASKAAVDALCVELSALAGACRPVVPVRAY